MDDKESFMVRMIIRLSGGRVTSPESATKILLVASGAILFLSVYLFLHSMKSDAVHTESDDIRGHIHIIDNNYHMH